MRVELMSTKFLWYAVKKQNFFWTNVISVKEFIILVITECGGVDRAMSLAEYIDL